MLIERSPGNKPWTPAYPGRKTEDITAEGNEQDSQVEREPRDNHILEATGAGGSDDGASTDDTQAEVGTRS